MRLTSATLAVAFLLSVIQTGEVNARSDVVVSTSGRSARVNPSVRARFQCLVNALDKVGYRIDFMGGYRAHGSVPRSKHPAGFALDINQVARNRVTRRFPSGVNQMAERCGLFHGALWRNADTGHFETRSPYMDRYHKRKRRHR